MKETVGLCTFIYKCDCSANLHPSELAFLLSQESANVYLRKKVCFLMNSSFIHYAKLNPT